MYEQIPFSSLVQINPPLDRTLPSPSAEVSFISMQDVTNSGDWSHRQSRRLQSIGSGYTPFQEDDVLFAKITPCMENGKGAHATALLNGLGFGSTEFHVLRAVNDTSSRFVFHVCNSRRFRQSAEAQMTGSAGQKRVPAEFFSRFFVPRFSRKEQRAIATVLDTMDEAIRRTEAVLAKLRQVKAGMLHDLLTRGLDENGELRDPLRHPEHFNKTPFGTIPKKWEVLPLQNIAEVSSGVTLGNTPQGAGTIELPYLRVANVQDGYLDLQDIKRVRIYKKDIDRFALRKGDVLMNEGGDFDKLGRGAIWEGQIEPCLHQNHVFRVRPFPNSLNSYFLDAVSSSQYGKGYFLLYSKQSTNLASINSTQLKGFPVPCPDLGEQLAIVASISAFDNRFAKEYDELLKLQKFKQGLMHDLLTGRVYVPPHLLDASS